MTGIADKDADANAMGKGDSLVQTRRFLIAVL